jgi:hypothetical protein
MEVISVLDRALEGLATKLGLAGKLDEALQLLRRMADAQERTAAATEALLAEQRLTNQLLEGD